MQDKKAVQQSNDPGIDRDFKAFPHGHAAENIIHPQNVIDEQTALQPTDGEKINYHDSEIKEELSDGSGDAFSAAETVRE